MLTLMVCPCGSPLGDSGSHTSSYCSKDRSLHVAHNSVLRVIDKAARSQGLSTTLELSSFSPVTGLPPGPDLTTTNWPLGKSLSVTDLAVTSPVSPPCHYLPTPSSLDPERLFKKREAQKVSKYRFLAESQRGEFGPLVVGTHGRVALHLQHRSYFKSSVLVETPLVLSYLDVSVTTG